MKSDTLSVREAAPDDVDSILLIERSAFGYDKEARLVAELLHDASAKPMLSLLAFTDNEPVGHILFTQAGFAGQKESPLMHILAPLAVKQEYQRLGIGGLLVNAGLETLKKRGSRQVFVLGHKEYYPKFGFRPHAARLGCLPPFPMPETAGEYWMVRSLSDDGSLATGIVKCADMLNKPEHWRDDEADR